MRLFSFLIIAVALAACDSSRVVEENKDFVDRHWLASDTVSIHFHISDTAQRYNIYYNVRNSLDYPWSRLFVNWQLRDSLNHTLQQHLSSAYLFDSKSGKPLGESALGDLYDHQIPALTHFVFRTPGTYRFSVHQFMRQDTLKGVLAAGVRVEKAATEK